MIGLKCSAQIAYALSEVARVGDPDKLPAPVRTVVLIHAAQGTIDNGGLRYFFARDFPANPPYTVFINAYREIGADAEADLLERAVRLFPFKEPHRFVNERNKHLGSFKDEDGDPVNCPFEPLTQELCGNKNVCRQLDRFVAKHADAFRK